MKKTLLLIITSVILLACQKDDLSWMQEIESIKIELANQKKLIEALQANANITGIETNEDSYTIYFSNSQSITLTNGKTPLVTIGDNGNWYINSQDTGCPSRGENGLDGADGSSGVTPTIEIIDGRWWINNQDTGIRAEGKDGASAPFICGISYQSSTISFIFSDQSVITIDVKLDYEKDIQELKQSLSDVQSMFYDQFCRLFRSVIHIGDSVTQGHIYDYPNTPENGQIMMDLSYPTFLGNMVGWNYTNAGFAGISSLGWWENKRDNYDYVNYELAIIELGYNKGLSNTVDTDAPVGTNYMDYIDTNTGRYCSIIEYLKEKNPKIFIVIVISNQFTNEQKDAIHSISERYDLPIIDLTKKDYINLDDKQYHGYGPVGYFNVVHFNVIGYFAKALFIKRELGRIIYENLDKVNNSFYK